jgi:hypothetical protein
LEIDDDLRVLSEEIIAAVGVTEPNQLREVLGPAVRRLTRLWAELNPEFDGDAWYPVSYMLTEHWDQIREHTERWQ